MIEFREKDNSVAFDVRVVPRASRTEVSGEFDGAVRIRLAAPPVDGAANDELIRFLARLTGVSRSAVEITAGHASRSKNVRITGVAASRLVEIFGI